MATLKLKYRPSAVSGRGGALFFQISHRGQVRQVGTGLRIGDGDWDPVAGAVVRVADDGSERAARLEAVTDALGVLHGKLLAVISGLERKGVPFTAGDVVAAYMVPQSVAGLVAFTRRLVGELKGVGKKATVKRYGTTLNCLLRYTGGKEVPWADLTPTFVVGFEEFLMKRGLCRNSTSFYMRNLRAIVNRAAEQGVSVPAGPFRHVYMGVDRTVKRAVCLDVIRRIRDVDLTGHPSLDFARKVFMFAFYMRGMSFVDIAFLKKSDLRNGVITYSRRKTRQQLMVRLEPETRRIIESFGKSETAFLLPIIKDEANDAEQQYENAYFRINRNIQKVGAMLGLDTKLTLYVARHAWASIAQSNNVALSTISKAMGHDSEKTTVIYLQSLDTSSVDKANSDIIRMMGRGKGVR